MGTDIHTWIQIKKNGKWETLNLYIEKKKDNDTKEYERAYTLVENRNYGLFGKIAGLRTWEDAIVPTRGWPDDITEDIQEATEYYFSPSYFDYCELKALAKTKDAISYYWDDEKGINVIEDWLTYIDFVLDAYGEYYPKPGECRIVFSFDN